MKIVHLSLSNDGGAGIAAYRLHKAMRELGIDSEMLVLYSKNHDPHVKVIDTASRPCLSSGPGMSPHFYIHEQRRHHLMAQHPSRDPNRAYFADASSEVVLEEIALIQDAAIINLHWVAGLVDYARMAHTFRGKKVVWTLHGMNDFTGGCHHADECLKYTDECAECPQLGRHDCFDYARHIFRQKLHGIRQLDVVAVCPSRWLKQCASQSTILSGKGIYHIPNGIPVDVFKPNETPLLKRFFDIPEDHYVILFGAFDASGKRKGAHFLLEALRLIPDNILSQVTVVGFGAASEKLFSSLNCRFKGLGSICDEHNLAMIYSMADLFVMPSMAENLPNSIIESLACGTPVVGFSVGGIPDIVQHMVNGYLATPFSSQDLAEGIIWCRHNQKRLTRETCATSVRYQFHDRAQALRYLGLYQTLLSDNSPAGLAGK